MSSEPNPPINRDDPNNPNPFPKPQPQPATPTQSPADDTEGTPPESTEEPA